MTRPTSDPRTAKQSRYEGLLAVQYATILVGAVLLALGVLGFIPGPTAHLDAMTLAGAHSGALLLGTFEVSVPLNLLHIVAGLAGLTMARSFALSRAFLLAAGLVYLGLWIWGLVTGYGSLAGVVPVNRADTWLLFGLGAAMVLFGLTLAGTRVPTGAGGEVLLPPS